MNNSTPVCMAPWAFEQTKTPYYTSDKNPSYHPSPQGRARPPATALLPSLSHARATAKEINKDARTVRTCVHCANEPAEALCFLACGKTHGKTGYHPPAAHKQSYVDNYNQYTVYGSTLQVSCDRLFDMRCAHLGTRSPFTPTPLAYMVSAPTNAHHYCNAPITAAHRLHRRPLISGWLLKIKCS